MPEESNSHLGLITHSLKVGVGLTAELSAGLCQVSTLNTALMMS